MSAWFLTDFEWYLGICGLCFIAFAVILHYDDKKYGVGFYDQAEDHVDLWASANRRPPR